MQPRWIQRIGVTATAVVLAGCSVAGPSASVVVEVPADGEVEVEIRLPQGFDPAATP